MSKAQEESARASLAARLAQGAMRGDLDAIRTLRQLDVPMVQPCHIVGKVAAFLSLGHTAQGFHLPPRDAMQDVLREASIGTPLHHAITSAQVWIKAAAPRSRAASSSKIVRLADYRALSAAQDTFRDNMAQVVIRALSEKGHDTRPLERAVIEGTERQLFLESVCDETKKRQIGFNANIQALRIQHAKQIMDGYVTCKVVPYETMQGQAAQLRLRQEQEAKYMCQDMTSRQLRLEESFIAQRQKQGIPLSPNQRQISATRSDLRL
ncbi:MAG: hypothetical protein IPI58_06665 [Alphaproteobacteria bacterium]|nr:MAG: hypothetical protein IPI58_06665 [Alphaproteobacteria bacterium]